MDTAVTTDTTLARGPLMLSPPPMLMLTMVDTTVLATEPTDMDILMDTGATDTDTTLARGPLMPSPPLMLMPMLTTDTTVLDTELPTDTAVTTDTTLARGPLMLSPPLMLMLTMVDTTDMLPTPTDMPVELMPTLPTPMVDTDPTWGNLPKPNQRSAFKQPHHSKMDLKFPST